MAAPQRPLHEDFAFFLEERPEELQALFHDVRNWVLALYPDGNELLYRTKALSVCFSTSLKLADGYMHIAVYQNHLNLGFNNGAVLDDPQKLLKGSGRLIRHIPIKDKAELLNPGIESIALDAIAYSINHMDPKRAVNGQVISKIKR